MFFVLDLDDTLYLERDFVRSGFQAVDNWVTVEFGINGFFDDAWNLFCSGERGSIFNEVMSRHRLAQDTLIDQMVTIYRTHKPKISLCTDSFEFLKSHKKSNIGIITDGFSYVQWSKILALDLKKFTERIIITDDLGPSFWKPHPRSFIEISRNHKSTECIYIADNPVKDFKAPKKLGWATSFRIRRRGSLHYNKKTPNGCIEITSLFEVNI